MKKPETLSSTTSLLAQIPKQRPLAEEVNLAFGAVIRGMRRESIFRRCHRRETRVQQTQKSTARHPNEEGFGAHALSSGADGACWESRVSGWKQTTRHCRFNVNLRVSETKKDGPDRTPQHIHIHIYIYIYI